MSIRYMPLRLVHSRREHGCLYPCGLMIWNICSYEPAVIMLGLSWEESQGDVPMIVSGKGFLARTANLPTRWGKRRGKLDSIENRDIVQRAAELEAGAAGTGHTNLWLHRCHCVSLELQHQLQLESQACTGSKGRVETFPRLDGGCVTLMPAGDSWGRKTCELYCESSTLETFELSEGYLIQNCSWTVHRPKIK